MLERKETSDTLQSRQSRAKTVLQICGIIVFFLAILAFPGVNIANSWYNKSHHKEIQCTIEDAELVKQSGNAPAKTLRINTEECGLVTMNRTNVEGISLEDLERQVNKKKNEKVRISVGAWQLHKNANSGYRVNGM